MATENDHLFQKMPVNKAVLTLALPTVLSQMISVIYNMADTFFIGQMNDPDQVAAATVAMPLFMVFTALSNLFGIGGSSLIARSLGAGDREKARKTASFCIIGASAISVAYGLLVLVLRKILLPALGADAYSYDYAYKYVLWTVTIGTLSSVMNPLLAHLIRSEGYSKQASIGVAFGGILNIALDPLFIFAFHLKIEGAAIATLLSNLAATAYFGIFLFRKRKVTTILPSFRKFTMKEGIPFEVAMVGLPSFTISFMASISNSVLNHMVSTYSNTAIAGMGIAKKINLMAFAVGQGMSQGALPLIGYNYTARNKERMYAAIRSTGLFSFGSAAVCTILLFFLAKPVTGLFIRDTETVQYAAQFLRTICFACPGTALSLLAITVFQATGRKKQPIILSLLRKGGLDVPLMFLFQSFMGINGLTLATPIADTVAAGIAMLLLLLVWKKKGLELPEEAA